MGNSTFSMLLLHLLLLSLMSSNAQSPTAQPPLGSTAQPPDTGASPSSSTAQPPAPGGRPKLPPNEVAALKDIILSLKTLEQITYYGSCEAFNGISCNCTFKNGTVCHVTSITMEKKDLIGVISPTIGELAYLEKLSFYGNKLHGSIPSSLWNLTKLTTLDLSKNQLGGVIPDNMEKMQELNFMVLSGNNITDKLPSTFEGLENLEIFVMSGNGLSGRVPNFMANWKWLRYLYVSDLRISEDSTFPPIYRLQTMNSLILRNCSIVGKIPEKVGRMALVHLDLSFNELSGEIPVGLQNLNYLCLSRNNFSGPFPSWDFQNASKFMDFSYNNFSVNSYDLDNMNGKQKYKYVNTFNCCIKATGVLHQKHDTRIQFTDPILQTIKNEHCTDEKSQYYSLHINCGGNATDFHGTKYEADNSTESFSVSQDKSWASSTSGNFITLSPGPQNYTVNKTCGSFVPDDILSTARISPLTLDYYGLCFRNDMYNVTLHFAEIVYTEVEDYSSLGIRLFDIYIQGERVKKDFNIEAEANTSGNSRVTLNFNATVTDNLLHIHFYWAGKGSVYDDPGLYGPLISAISVTSDYKPGRSSPVVTITSITVASLGFLLALFAFIAWKMGFICHEELYELEGAELEKRNFTYRDIVDATQNFRDKHKIGIGGAGTIYKAVVPEKGTLAVKKLLKSSMVGLNEFTNEVKKIESLKNDSLVQLLGWFAGDDQHWLIYEYMEENSLHRALFENKVELSWGDRYRICLQIAMGLVYLHETADPKIIHRDITPSNILLDKKFNAKISDFGLARFYNEEQHSQFTKICGTHGYMAPEYAMRGFLSVKTDVYSYGVVILEIVSGKSNTNDKPNQESRYLLDQAFVKQKKGELLDLVAENVTFMEDYKQEEATIVLDLVMLCTDRSPTLRPTMLEVLSVLQKERTIEEISGTKKSPRRSGPEHCTACGFHLQSDANTSADGISNE